MNLKQKTKHAKLIHIFELTCAKIKYKLLKTELLLNFLKCKQKTINRKTY